MSEDLQSSVSPPAADQMGQIQFGHAPIQWYELSSPFWKQLGHVNGISPSCFYYGKLFVSVDFTDVTKKLEGALGEEVKVKEPINQQIHRMCLLRVKLMHFVNSLHNYITTRVRLVMKQTFSQQTVTFVECHQSSLSEFSHY